MVCLHSEKGVKMLSTPRWRAAGLHGAVSLLVAAGAAALVFGVWFPGAYRYMSGGMGLFMLIVGVDVVMGPLLTLVAFNPLKTRRHLAMDLMVIALLQLAALAYGVFTVAQVRPVALAAENRLFRVVAAQDIKPDERGLIPPKLAVGWLDGPRLVGVRPVGAGDERLDAIMWALKGYDVGTRPRFWQDYEAVRVRVLAQALPLTQVFAAQLGRHAALDEAVLATKVAPDVLRVLPVLARQADWYVLLDARDASVLGFVHVPGAETRSVGHAS